MIRKISLSILPDDLSGITALDIGCNAGFYSVELARRGAKVFGIDVNDHYLTQARWAAEVFHISKEVEFKKMQVYDLARLESQFDIVLFLGVFYHLRYPLLGLDIISQKVKRLMIFQTLTMPGEQIYPPPKDFPLNGRDIMLKPGWPKMAFIENRLANDPTNWWAPNHAGVEAMLRSSGLKFTARPGHEIYFCEPDVKNKSCVATWNEDEFLSATGLSLLPGKSKTTWG